MNSHDPMAEDAAALAEIWQNRANELLTQEEKGIQEQMIRLVNHPQDKITLVKLIDRSFRSRDTNRVANQINDLLQNYGVPDFFSTVERLLTRMFLSVGRHLPKFSVPQMIHRMRQDSSRAIIPGEPKPLHAHLEKRRRQGIRMNINHIGEAVLGEGEAASRLKIYLEDLKDPAIECISVKISTLYSQISPLAFDDTVSSLKKRLSQLYRTGRSHTFVRHDGKRVRKFVNLDMEDYRDLGITTGAFKETLNQMEFQDYSAGIALQAYLPDSWAIQKDLTKWAKKRVSGGGSPVKIRIVKGANMEMELLDSALNRWPLAPYDNKQAVDANYKRMVAFGMRPENIEAIHLGIASHNLFDLAYAHELATCYKVAGCFSFEMLEGMANHVRRAIHEMSGNVLLYAPVATRNQFINAIAYLIRRLDENTAGDNFLRYSFDLHTDSDQWRFLRDQFFASFQKTDKPSPATHRCQNRRVEAVSKVLGTYQTGEFANEPNTDWSLAENRKWAEGIRDKWKMNHRGPLIKIPLVIGGEEIYEGRRTRRCMDLAQLNKRAFIATYSQGNARDVDFAVSIARRDPAGWRKKNHRQRHRILSRVAGELRRARGDLIGAAAVNTGKVFMEADPEVSEAIDFAEFYPHSVKTFTDMIHIRGSGKGVGVVISPWNFPIAIPCGGIVSALASGNTVIFKPASFAVLVAWILCQCFWKAGIPKTALQFLPCSGSTTAGKLTGHPDIDFTILTGGTETGLAILRKRPNLFLAAETGGKNATIVTAMSDRDQAIKNVVTSTFGNGGQKCSATSLLILEREVFEDKNFRGQLVDAARSIPVGSAWQFEHRMGPLIQPPSGELKHALTQLEPGESWALKPQCINGNPWLWSPGIKWDVSPGSITHMTEFFGPLLGVMKADTLEHAIELANQTGYGLTSGLESLDEAEQKKWKDRIRAGNLYINRETTGAMVLRQPFGGVGKSSLGAGIKVGFFNYVSQFMEFKEKDVPPIAPLHRNHPLLKLALEWQKKLHWGNFVNIRPVMLDTVRAIRNYLYRFEQEFSQEKDYFHLRGQDNRIRYQPVGKVILRLHPQDTPFDLIARLAAAYITGCTPIISIPPHLKSRATELMDTPPVNELVGSTPVRRESDRELCALIPAVDRIRYAAPDRVPQAVSRAAADTGFYIARNRVMTEGRLELLNYLREQSICINYHRYGNLGDRALEVNRVLQ